MKAFGSAARESVPPGAMTGLKEFLDGVHPRGNREYVIAWVFPRGCGALVEQLANSQRDERNSNDARTTLPSNVVWLETF